MSSTKDYDLAYSIVEQMGLGFEFRNCRLAEREAEVRADLLQRVPDEKRLAEIRERQLLRKKWGNPPDAEKWATDDIDYLLSLLQQPPAASERCGESTRGDSAVTKSPSDGRSERRTFRNDYTCVKCLHNTFSEKLQRCVKVIHARDGEFQCNCKCVFSATGATSEQMTEMDRNTQTVYVSRHPLHLHCNTCGLEQVISLQCPRGDGQLVTDDAETVSAPTAPAPAGIRELEAERNILRSALKRMTEAFYPHPRVDTEGWREEQEAYDGALLALGVKIPE